ncbi:hypothetical protein [Ensifer sp. ENS12]|uniref:hypothetical protein n=1 Tax=Ensifer sp. ENS12 TaxID=2854774 RepID=UPI000DE5ADC0|nr:hypothetical protein [Ensifer sp. ENS12]MBV7522051.1 hypothetical protein [Ensifer sp. ENS12]
MRKIWISILAADEDEASHHVFGLEVDSLDRDSTKELDIAAMQATRFGLKPMPAADRQALAEAALAYWKSFDSRIPRNSPQTLEWLRGEMNTTDGTRISKVTGSPEYAVMHLADISENCVSLFESLTKSIAGDRLTEMYLWTKTLSCHKSPDDLLVYLQRAGLSNGRYDGEFQLQHFGFYHSTVTGHIANALISEPVQ